MQEPWVFKITSDKLNLKKTEAKETYAIFLRSQKKCTAPQG